MKNPYEDILALPHPTSPKHPRMSRAGRAAQFSPFAALSSHRALLAETERQPDRWVELDEDAKAELDRTQRYLLDHLAEQPEISAVWFQPDDRKDGGVYRTAAGRLKRIDLAARRMVLTGGVQIPLDSVVALECGEEGRFAGPRER